MNKVFKVIWSEARNAYVVVSEMAKSHGTKSCSTKKLLAMLIATGVMTCASVAPVMAEDVDNLAPTKTKIVIGKDAEAIGIGCVAIGNEAKAKDGDTVAIGQKASASVQGSIAIGNNATASDKLAIAIGRDAAASGADSIAIGSKTIADQRYSVAIGNDISVIAEAGTAVGQQAYASGKNATAIGYYTNVDSKWSAAHQGQRRNAGENSTAIGVSAGSWGDRSTAVGSHSKAEGEKATALGSSSKANYIYATAIGGNSQANARGTALGFYSKVTAFQGVAIGDFSVADRESGVVGAFAPEGEDSLTRTWKATGGAVSVGSDKLTRQITNVAAGSEDTDAVNVGQLKKVVAAGDTDVHIKAGEYKVDDKNKVAMNLVDKAGNDEGTVTITGVAKAEDVAVVYDKNKTSLRSTNAGVAENAIALGKGASAVKNSIAIGNGAYTQDGTLTRGQSVALGNGAVTGAKSTSIASNAVGGREGTITIGANANNGSLYATVIGTDSKVNNMTRNSGAAATIVGAKSEIKNDNKSYSGVANGIFGSANTIENSNGVTIQGSGNTVTNAYKNMSGGDFNLGGVYVKKDAGAVGVIGGMNTVSNQIYTNVIGFGNTVAGDADNISHDVFVAGSRNNLSKVSDSIVMGNDNTISDRSNVISFGHQNTISASNAVAIGNGASVSVEGGVALGVGSVADRANAVSVGSTGANRQIINVAAGEDTDAVNVSQLNAVKETANKGWNLSTNGFGTEATNVKPGDYVDFRGDKNISVSHDGTKVQVELNKNIDVNSIQTNALNSTTGAKLGQVTIAADGKISGVAAGEADTDAVNVSQLNAVATEAGKHTTLSNGKNTTVESTVKDGQTDYKVNVAGDLTDITSVANGDSKINLNKDSIIISNGNKYFAITNSGIGMSYIGADYSAKSIMLGENGTTISGGLNVAGSKITGVAAGEVSPSTDAINGSQLHAVKTELQTSDKHLVGNPASADGYYKPDANGDISMRVEDQNKNGYDVVIKDVASKAELGDVANRVTNVENKVTQIETDVTTIKTDITTIKTDITNINTRVDNVEALAGKHTTLEKNGTNINVDETVVDGQKNYKVNLNKNITLGDENDKNVSISGTNGTITATGDITTANRINAANGGKLADIDVTGNKLSNGNSSITLDGTNVKVNDKVTVDKDGKISGVAKGDISNTSTDAVNGSQLYDTNTHITNVENQVISNSNRINQLGNRVNKVGAGAAALAALHPMDFDPDDKLTFSAGYGNYGGENAAAIGAYYRPDEKVMFSVAGTVGNGENMVNAGVSFALDRTNHVSNSRTALAREVIDLRGQLAVMGAKMAKMEKAFGMLDETKTKLFPDVPANHWAYEYIAKLAGNGYIEGYPDGNFGGDRLMTRYEFAAMLYRAIEKGAALEEKIIKEFEPELGRIRVDRISGEDGDRDKIERVRVNDTKGERDHYGNKLAK